MGVAEFHRTVTYREQLADPTGSMTPRVGSSVSCTRSPGREASAGWVFWDWFVVRSSLWSVGTLAFSGSAFALLVPDSDVSFVATVAAWATAWTAGFLVLVVPAGVGPREGVLAATVAAPGGVAPVIAASVVHRLVIMVGEVVMIGASRLRARRLSKISRDG